MNTVSKELAECVDAASLAARLRIVCSEFGAMARLEILTMTDCGRRHALCLLRLDSSEREVDLMTKIGAGRFGDDLCVVVDLKMHDRARLQSPADPSASMETDRTRSGQAALCASALTEE